MTDVVIELRKLAATERKVRHYRPENLLAEEIAANEIEFLRAVNAKMLAALKGVETALVDAFDGMEMRSHPRKVLASVRKIIAKAEGKS
jgi:hypothetical protein